MSDDSPRPAIGLGWRRAWRYRLDPNRWPAALLLYTIVAAVVCFWRLGATGLVSMEGMVVDGARHMLESGDWIVPRVYGEIYTYKPALAYWLAALPLALVEDPSEGLLRLPFAASGFAMGLVVLLLVGRVAGVRAGLLSAIASVTGVLFLLKSRMAEFDVSLTAGVGVAVAAACFNLSAPRQRWAVWLLGYLGLAVGFLTKGIPALVVYGPGLLSGAWAGGRLRRLFDWRHLAAVVVFAAITGAYLWAAWEAVGPAVVEQPIIEARARGFGQLSEEDLESFPEARRFGANEAWVEWPLLAVAKPVLIWAAFMPWTVLILYLWRRRAELHLVVGRTGRCAAGFAAAGVLMFMLTPTHEMRYYLPLAVPIGILFGLAADRLLEGDREKTRGQLAAAVVVAAVVAAATVALAVLFPSPLVPLASRFILAVAGLVAGTAIVYLRHRSLRHALLPLLAIVSLCAMLAQYLGFEPYRAGKRDMSPEARVLSRHLPAGEPVWVLGPADEAGKHASLLFYLDRPIRAFRLQDGLPASGVRCLLTARDLGRLAEMPGFIFSEIARAEHVWFDYRLGVCFGIGRPAAGDRPPFG